MTKKQADSGDTSARECVLCPVRGGKRSSNTVDRAIATALELEAKLVFLYIVDIDFLGYATVARVKLMVDELVETGRFALSILSDKARGLGVEQVDTIIREGSIRAVIREAIAGTGATVLVTGRPGQTPGVVSFSLPAFEAFLNQLKQETGVRVEWVE